MSVPRRSAIQKQSVAASAMPAEGIRGLWEKYGNAVATGLLLVALVFLVIRWRTSAAAQARSLIEGDLSTARDGVTQLRDARFLSQPPALLAHGRDQIVTQVNVALASVLNSGPEADIKARAFLEKGNLNWQLANLPALPGAATQPALRPLEDDSAALDKAGSAYNDAMSAAGAGKSATVDAEARLGLAAIAENRSQFDKARDLFQLVVKAADTDPALSVYGAIATAQLATLPALTTPVYLAPPTHAASQPSPAAAASIGPPAPASVAPAPMSRVSPATRPTTRR